MNNLAFDIKFGNSPIVGAAIHNGHAIRDDVQQFINLSEPERLREEDPYTGAWADVVDTTIKGKKSRFEVDLNRSRDKAIYLKPEDAWGLHVWKQDLPESVVNKSLAQYDDFYGEVRKLLSDKIAQYGHVIVLDIHSYNHQRDGADGPYANPEENPEINIGTSNMNRELWEPVVEGLMQDLRDYNYFGRSLDVRENVKFKGGFFSNWIHSEFPDNSCSISIEYKKIFMNEWTGELDKAQHKALVDALAAAVPGVLERSSEIVEHA